MKLGIIDNGIIPEGSNAVSCIQELMENAALAEQLSYSRYWITEHHRNDCSWHTPEIIIPLLAASTEQIRIGVAGVLLPIHNHFLIAQRYKLLNNLFNNRIDLGISRAVPAENLLFLFTEKKTREAVLLHHYEKVTALLAMFNDDYLPVVSPKRGTAPEIWMLGTSLSSSDFVTQQKLAFSFSAFHPQSAGVDLNQLLQFSENYQQKNKCTPTYSLAISVIADNNKNKLKQHTHAFNKLYKNELRINLCGSYSYIKEQLREYHEKYKPSELIILNGLIDQKEKQEFYTTLAELITPHP